MLCYLTPLSLDSLSPPFLSFSVPLSSSSPAPPSLPFSSLPPPSLSHPSPPSFDSISPPFLSVSVPLPSSSPSLPPSPLPIHSLPPPSPTYPFSTPSSTHPPPPPPSTLIFSPLYPSTTYPRSCPPPPFFLPFLVAPPSFPFSSILLQYISRPFPLPLFLVSPAAQPPEATETLSNGAMPGAAIGVRSSNVAAAATNCPPQSALPVSGTASLPARTSCCGASGPAGARWRRTCRPTCGARSSASQGSPPPTSRASRAAAFLCQHHNHDEVTAVSPLRITSLGHPPLPTVPIPYTAAQGVRSPPPPPSPPTPEPGEPSDQEFMYILLPTY